MELPELYIRDGVTRACIGDRVTRARIILEMELLELT